MTKTTRPTGPRNPSGADAVPPRSWLREQVRQHMLKMAPLALATAAPLAAGACDPVPGPECTGYVSDWKSYLSSHASWGEDQGNRIVLLDLNVGGNLQTPTSYTIVGGSFLTAGKSNQLRIKPDPGATVITLRGEVTGTVCYSYAISITIDLVPPDGGSADAAPIVKIS